MTNFDRITASPEALADFLGQIAALETPWDHAFHRAYCDACEAENCDAENCPNQAARDNPLWYLKQEAAEDGKATAGGRPGTAESPGG